MAPLLKTLYRPSQRSLLSSLFTATFLGAVVVVAFPCPVRPLNQSGMAETMLEDRHRNSVSEQNPKPSAGADTNGSGGYGMGKSGDGQVVVLMNKRGRRFMEES